MNRFFTLVTLLIVLAGNTFPLMHASGGVAPVMTATTDAADSDTPDCCKDGMCPTHQQKQKAETPDCSICGMSSTPQATLVATVQAPAILSSAAVVLRTEVRGSVPDLPSIETFNLDLPILTPPPRA